MAFDEEDLDPHGECAHEITRLTAELKAVRAALAVTLEWSTHETEYDGRMYDICQSCSGQDGEHKAGCELPAFRALTSSEAEG